MERPSLAFVAASIHQLNGFLNREQSTGEAGVHHLRERIQALALEKIVWVGREVLGALLASHQLLVVACKGSAGRTGVRLDRRLEVNGVNPEPPHLRSRHGIQVIDGKLPVWTGRIDGKARTDGANLALVTDPPVHGG